MRGRNALLVGFGLGGLVVLAVVILTSGGAALVAGRNARNVASPLPSATPSQVTVPPVSPTPSSSASTPGPRAGAMFVYDPENHGVVLFGGAQSVATPDGHSNTTTMDDTWVWNGAAWTRLNVQGPPARGAATAVYDSARHVVVLFGGSGPAGAGQALLFQDTWIWDGTQWQQLHPIHSPNPRFDAAMAFDAARGEAVLYGGYGDAGVTYTATWTWDGSDWTLQDPKTVPPTRHFESMAYDAARGVTVLFGGTTPGVRLNDTWLWDGTNWSQANTAAPAASGFSELVYDSADKQVVAYIYFALDNNPVAEYTISWDGTRWTDRTTTSDPSPRAFVSLAYDPETKQVVLYGPGDELWTWNGAGWSLWQPRQR